MIKIPRHVDYSNFLEEKYKIADLDIILKHYKLKKSGNKKAKTTRIYDHLCFSFYSTRIQKIIRGFLIRKLLKLKGEGIFKREQCINDEDFYSFDKINKISFNQFFSFKDETDGKIYGFDIISFNSLLMNSQKEVLNPYTRNKITSDTILKFRDLLKLSNCLKLKYLRVEKSEKISPNQLFKNRVTNAFVKIDSLGNYTNPDWFNTLNIHQHVRFIKELYDIWSYRASLSSETKYQICPPTGNPFLHFNIVSITNIDFKQLRNINLTCIENMINKSLIETNQQLGALYVLSALSIVNQDVAAAMPWLYESVALGQ